MNEDDEYILYNRRILLFVRLFSGIIADSTLAYDIHIQVECRTLWISPFVPPGASFHPSVHGLHEAEIGFRAVYLWWFR